MLSYLLAGACCTSRERTDGLFAEEDGNDLLEKARAKQKVTINPAPEIAPIAPEKSQPERGPPPALRISTAEADAAGGAPENEGSKPPPSPRGVPEDAAKAPAAAELEAALPDAIAAKAAGCWLRLEDASAVLCIAVVDGKACLAKFDRAGEAPVWSSPLLKIAKVSPGAAEGPGRPKTIIVRHQPKGATEKIEDKFPVRSDEAAEPFALKLKALIKEVRTAAK